jgi:hypothetical protein
MVFWRDRGQAEEIERFMRRDESADGEEGTQVWQLHNRIRRCNAYRKYFRSDCGGGGAR